MKDMTFKKVFTLILEPIALGLLALLFIIPTVTVLNLQPITKKLDNLNILGASNKSELQINIVEGSHQIFKNEKVQEQDGIYTYSTELLKRESDSYSKPILEVLNNTGNEVTLEMYGGTSVNTGSNIGVIIKDQLYKLQDQRGNMANQRVTLLPNQRYIIYLSVESFSDIQFQEDFTLTIKQ